MNIFCNRKKSVKLILASGLVALSTSALASVDFSATGTGGRAASASFNVNSSGNLEVTLASLGSEPAPNWDGTYVLTALFFNYTGTGSLSANPSSDGAVVDSGGGMIGTLPAGTTIGSYWAYGEGLTSAPGGATEGLLAVGFGVGNPPNGNLGPNGQKVGGIDGGLLGWNSVAQANSSVQGKDPFAFTSITFTLQGSGLPTTLAPSDFSNVSFQYGTALGAPNLSVPIPEQSTFFAGVLLLLPVGLITWRSLLRRRLS